MTLAWATVDAILFDGEGVAIDTEPIWDLAQKDLLARRGVAYDRSQVKHLIAGRSSEEGMEVLRQAYRLTEPAADLARERVDLMAALLASQAAFIPGFLAFYERASARYRTALATSMDAHLLAAVDHRLGIRSLFGGRVFTSSDVARAKPWPDLFLLAARSLGVTPPRCIVIEDSPIGIEAARKAGMRSIGITTTFERGRLGAADAIVDRFEDIPLPGPAA